MSTKTAIIIHGTPSREVFLDPDSPSQSNSHWIPWVQQQLLIRGYHTWTPEMPVPYAPDYDLWSAEFKRYPVNQESVLIGHSCGAGFLLRWLSENPVAVRRTILVAPWLDPYAVKCSKFFEFEIDRNLGRRTDLHLFESDNDDSDIIESVKRIKTILPTIRSRIFRGYGHFCFNDMKTNKFPELVETIFGGEG